MKLDKLFAVSVVAALAVAVSGCRYNKSGANGEGEGEAEGGSEVATVDTAEGQDLDNEAANEDALLGNVVNDDGSIATEIPFDKNPDLKPVDGADFAPVYFGFDSDAIPGAEIAKIEDVANDLQQNPGHVAIVSGNCDERGANEYNLSLGEKRAIMVRDYLVRLGIAPARLQTKSYGEENPAVMGSGESVWSKNRRAEFELFEHK